MAKTSTARPKKSSKKPTTKAVKTSSARKPKAVSKVAAKATKAASTAKSKITFESLNKWNLTMAALHFVQGVAVVLLSSTNTLPVNTSYLALDTLASKSGNPVLASASRHLFDVNLAYLVAAFFFISAAAHLIIGTIYRKTYEANLQKGINRARWYEYSVSASVMMVAIAMLSGVYDLSALLMIFALDFVMNMTGLIMEVHNQDRGPNKPVSWLSFAVGCVAGIVPWIVFAIYVIGANLYGGGQIPTFVYWIYASLFLFFTSFAVNMFLQYKKVGKWADYLYGERVYMILSLVAKSALAWQVFFGALRP